MRANVDLEFVLHLLDLVTSLVPELTSEEVLAKMCRKKAKLAVRHTVSNTRTLIILKTRDNVHTNHSGGVDVFGIHGIEG